MIKRYLEALTHVLFPRICFICETKITDGFLCERCKEKITFLRPPLCKICAKHTATMEEVICFSCRKKKVHYDRLIACLHYHEPIKTLIHLFKYRHYDYLGKYLSSFMIDYLLKIGFKTDSFDIAMPVPSHPLRLEEKEYNQSYLLAQELSVSLGVPLKNNILVCNEMRPSQTKLKKQLRPHNVDGIFEAKEHLKDKRILLVDDIITTGATVSECAKALKEKGACVVTVLALAKAQ